jgi:NAD-dependent deacetylase
MTFASLRFSDSLVNSLVQAQHVVAFTGAGISAESGVPTFRGPEGIWSKFKPEELASMEAFMKNPALVWEWYAHRKTIIATVQPNPGHVALARMEALFPRFTLITQNIDNLHRRAGSTMVHELHGNIERSYCMGCGKLAPDVALSERGQVPTCSACGGIVRPDVVWFGEMLPEKEWEVSTSASESADVFLSIGTSAVVYPAASLPLMAKHSGAYLVEINTESTMLTSRADEFLCGPSGTVLPLLYEAVAGREAPGRRAKAKP